MNAEVRFRPVIASYNLGVDILRPLGSPVVSCQCITRGKWSWPPAKQLWQRTENEIAVKPCSSLEHCKSGRAMKLSLGDHGDHHLWVVRDVHPMYRLHHLGFTVWESLFQEIYIPCTVWHGRQMVVKYMVVVDGMQRRLDLHVKDNELEQIIATVSSSVMDLRDALAEFTMKLEAARVEMVEMDGDI